MQGAELPQGPSYTTEQLLQMASQARERAHAPFSRFRVGAALLTKDGKVYTGCNVESASFTPTMCAERVAIGSALAAGEQPGSFTVIAIVADNVQPTTPCGVCRQVLFELAPGVSVVMASAPEMGDAVMTRTIEELLPDGFRAF